MLNLSQAKLDNIINDPQSGIYLIDKPKGEHSFAAVSILRKTLNIKRIGFAGTLDPLASGLLILATGKATQLLDYFHQWSKTYVAEVLFGQTFDTYDLAGEIIINKEAKEFSQEFLQSLLKDFLGKQLQTVPIYSAKKINGEKLHHLARRGGTVELPKNNIEIFKLTIKEFEYPKVVLEVTCSVGTYIRSLAYDLGMKVKTGALLANLQRTKIGRFDLADALPLGQVSSENLVKYKLLVAEIIESLK